MSCDTVSLNRESARDYPPVISPNRKVIQGSFVASRLRSALSDHMHLPQHLGTSLGTYEIENEDRVERGRGPGVYCVFIHTLDSSLYSHNILLQYALTSPTQLVECQPNEMQRIAKCSSMRAYY